MLGLQTFTPDEILEFANHVVMLAEEAYAAMDTADLHDLIGICTDRIDELQQTEKLNTAAASRPEHRVAMESSQLTLVLTRAVVNALDNGRAVTDETINEVLGMFGIQYSRGFEIEPVSAEIVTLGL